MLEVDYISDGTHTLLINKRKNSFSWHQGAPIRVDPAACIPVSNLTLDGFVYNKIVTWNKVKMYEKMKKLFLVISSWSRYSTQTANKNNNKNDVSLWNGEESAPIKHVDICCALVFQFLNGIHLFNWLFFLVWNRKLKIFLLKGS